MFIRYYLPENKEERLGELVEFCKKTETDGILFFTSSYDSQPSFIDIEKYRNYAKKLKKWAILIKKENLRFGINMLQTLGHIYFPKKIERKFPFQRKVDINGIESKGGCCPLDENFKKYIYEVYQVFASLKPDIIYVDDDFRYIMDGFFCFCPLHLKKYEKETGEKITREKLKEEILKETFIPSDIKKKYFEILNLSLKEVAELIEKAVHSISPETRVGLMLQTFPMCFWGTDINEIIKTLAGNRQPLCRPQLPIYKEYGFDLKLSIPLSFAQPLIIRNLINKDVEIQPEIENYPYSIFSKSKQIFKYQISFCYINGFEKPLVNIFDTYGQKFDENIEFIEVLKKNKKFFGKLKEISKNNVSKGISIIHTSKTTLFTTPQNKNLYTIFNSLCWDRIIPLLGLPISYNWNEPEFYILSGNEVLGLEKEKLEKIIKNGGVIIDKDALQILQYLGYEKKIGVKCREAVPIDDCGSIYFHKNKINGPYQDEFFPVRFATFPKDFVNLEILSEKFETIASLVNFENKIVSPAIVITENKYGAKFGIFSFVPTENLLPVFLNPKTQVLLRNLFPEINGKSLPISITNHPYLVPYYFEGKNGIFILILNLSSDKVSNIVLNSQNIFNKKCFKPYLLLGNGKFIEFNKKVKFEKKENIIKIQYNLSPFEFLIMSFRK